MGANLLVAGYFGCGNLGDDAILLGFLTGCAGRDVSIQVLSGAPEETYRLYGVSSVPRKEMGPVHEAINKCDALIFAGGSIFQDVSSVKSVMYYEHLASYAKKAGKKVIMLAQGVGPLTSFFGKRHALKAFSLADLITVRDQGSVQTLRELGVKATPRVTADMAYLLPKQQPSEETIGFQVGDMKTIGLAPRPFGKDKGKEVIRLFGELARMLFQNKMLPVLIEMDRQHDGDLINEIDKAQGGKVPSIRKTMTPMQLQQRMARMESVIAMRLHAGILATTVDVPPYMVSYDPKVNAFCNSMELPAPLSVTNLTPTRLFEGFMAFQKDRDRYQKNIQRKREELRKQAELNFQFLFESVRA